MCVSKDLQTVREGLRYLTWLFETHLEKVSTIHLDTNFN